ncbi:hypothetical protein PMAYCL1PPCAC_23876, partial [Pristionchus mayeri]
EGDADVKDVIMSKEIRDAIGQERLNKLEEMFKSVKRWRKKGIEDLVKRYSERCPHKNISLKEVTWDQKRMNRFLLTLYRDSFPSPLIGEQNIEKLILWITAHLMGSEKAKMIYNPPLLKYRKINWLKRLGYEKEKRQIVKRVTTFIIDYIKSIIRFCFKSIPRNDGTLFVPKWQFRYMEQACFVEYEKLCELANSDQARSTFDLRIIPVGNTLRPIVMKKKKKSPDARRREKVYLAALQYHASRFGVSSANLSTCQQKIAAFSSRAKEKIFYIKSDIRKFFPSIDQNELMRLLSLVVSEDCTVLTLEYNIIIRGRKYLKVRNKAAAQLTSAKSALDSSLNHSSHLIFNKKFIPTDISRGRLMTILISEIKHTVAYRGAVYSVGRGIGQGSIYSTVLGEIYLHEFMKRRLPIPPRDSLLLFYADDFIMLSRLIHIVQNFHEGILQEEMGIQGNYQKTITNINGHEYRVLHWCGLTFDTTRFAQIKRSIEKK